MMTHEQFDEAIAAIRPVLVKFAIKHGADPVPWCDLDRAASDLNMEDVLQEALERAWKSLPHFQGRSKFSTWVMQIVRNVIRDRIEQRESRRRERRLARAVAQQALHPKGCQVSSAPTLSDLQGDGEPEPGEVTAPDAKDIQQITRQFQCPTAMALYRTALDPPPANDEIDDVRLPDDESWEWLTDERRAQAIRSLVPEAIDDSPDASAENHQLRDRLEAAMDAEAIPGPVRMALWSYAAGATWAHIAKEMGCDRKQLEYRTRVSLKALGLRLRDSFTKKGSVAD